MSASRPRTCSASPARASGSPWRSLNNGRLPLGTGSVGLAKRLIDLAIDQYQANRAMQLKGGAGYMRDQPYEQIMRDIRIFSIFERTNDVLRSFVALSALRPLGDELKVLADADLSNPIGLVGAYAGYLAGRLQRGVRPDRVRRAHDELSGLAGPVGDQVARLRPVGEGLLRRHGKGIVDQGLDHKRLAAALSDIYAQIAVLSRVTSIFEEQGADASGQERFIAETFCTRAARRVGLELDKIEDNDDERMHSIARLAYRRGAYG